MTNPSEPASQALIYCSYVFFLATGLYLAWSFRNQKKEEFIYSGRTQSAIPLAFNFMASATGSSILLSFPEIATISGIQGAIVYSAACSFPLILFAYLTPIIRKKAPNGFILTMWASERYGLTASLYLSFLSVATMFLFMIAELSSLQQVLNYLTGLNALPVIIVEVIVTSAYTALGGFRISFITDNIQGAMIGVLILICSIAVGTQVHIDKSMIEPSGLTHGNKLGYQLIYILTIAILTNNLFLSGFWMRAFASRSDRDLWIGVTLGSTVTFVVLMLVSSTGLIAAWSGLWVPGEYGGLAFFKVLATLPAWVVGFVIVMVCCLSCAVFDSLQSSMVSTLSNDLFRNKLPLVWVRVVTVLIIVPTIVLALKSPSVLRIFLISDIFSSAVIPTLLLGLIDSLYFIKGIDIVIAGCGGLISVWIFGTIYYGNAHEGAQLLILVDGLYADDWSVFGTFVAAPVGSFIFLALSIATRMTGTWAYCRITGRRFDCFDKPPVPEPTLERYSTGSADIVSPDLKV